MSETNITAMTSKELAKYIKALKKRHKKQHNTYIKMLRALKRIRKAEEDAAE